MRGAVLCRSKVLHGEHGHGDHQVKWYQKHKVWQGPEQDGLAVYSQHTLVVAATSAPPSSPRSTVAQLLTSHAVSDHTSVGSFMIQDDLARHRQLTASRTAP